MSKIYKYEVAGHAADDQTWKVNGYITTERPGDFALTPDRAMRDAFTKLTNGRAVYGLPGVGCKGPYRISRLLIEEVLQ